MRSPRTPRFGKSIQSSEEAPGGGARTEQNFARLGELEHVQIPDVRSAGSTRPGAAVAKEAIAEEGRRAASPRASWSTKEDVARVLGDLDTGIRVAKMLEAEEPRSCSSVEERLGAARRRAERKRCSAVARAVRRGRVGLRDPGKPIGSFFFLGPTRRRQDRARARRSQSSCSTTSRRMTRLDMRRVHGEAHGAAPRRRAAGLRRQRREEAF